jgi:hypothetical protein
MPIKTSQIAKNDASAPGELNRLKLRAALVRPCILIAFCAATVPIQVYAADGDQQFAQLGQCKLESGKVIEDCRIGYRTLGRSRLALWGQQLTHAPGRHHAFLRHRH